MDKWYADIDKFIESLGGINVYLTFLLKAVAALVIAVFVWLIVKRILSSFEKRTK